MPVATALFDPADYLDTDEEIAVFLTEALSSGDARHIARALSAAILAQRRWRATTAPDAEWETLSAAVDEAQEADVALVVRVLDALGLTLKAEGEVA